MVKINLLPWREELQRQKQQEFFMLLGLALLVTGLLFVGAYFYIEGRKTYQLQRNEYLTIEIEKLNQKIAAIKDINTKKNKLRDKIKVIEGFQANRSEIIHVIDELRKITPRGISLASVVQNKDQLDNTKDKLEIKGFLIANSNSEVPLLMDAITLSSWLELDGTGLKAVDGRERVKPEKDATEEQAEEQKYSQFTILAKQVNRNKKKESEDEENEDEDGANNDEPDSKNEGE